MRRRRFSARDREKRLADFSGCCAACRSEITPASGLEWDHVIPLELGGWRARGIAERKKAQMACRDLLE